jgi:hypothetical protein
MRAISRPPYTPWQPIAFALVPAEPGILHRYRDAPLLLLHQRFHGQKSNADDLSVLLGPHQHNATSQQSTPEQDKQNDDRQRHSKQPQQRTFSDTHDTLQTYLPDTLSSPFRWNNFLTTIKVPSSERMCVGTLGIDTSPCGRQVALTRARKRRQSRISRPLAVECRRSLIKHDDIRLVQEDPRERETLLLTA